MSNFFLIISKLFLSIILSIILVIYSSPLFAGPPFITDDPYVPEYKKGELHFFLFGESLTHVTNVFFPALEIEYGILPNVEFHVVTAIMSNFAHRQNNHYGLADTELALKYEFLTEEKNGLAVAIEPFAFLATGDANHGLGNGRTFYSLSLWAGKHIDKWEVYGGAGKVFNGAVEANNVWYGGIVVERKITEKLELGAELFIQGRESISIDDDSGAFKILNLGGTWDINDTLALDFSIGHSVNGEKGWVSYIGLTWEFGQGDQSCKDKDKDKEKEKEKEKKKKRFQTMPTQHRTKTFF